MNTRFCHLQANSPDECNPLRPLTEGRTRGRGLLRLFLRAGHDTTVCARDPVRPHHDPRSGVTVKPTGRRRRALTGRGRPPGEKPCLCRPDVRELRAHGDNKTQTDLGEAPLLFLNSPCAVQPLTVAARAQTPHDPPARETRPCGPRGKLKPRDTRKLSQDWPPRGDLRKGPCSQGSRCSGTCSPPLPHNQRRAGWVGGGQGTAAAGVDPRVVVFPSFVIRVFIAFPVLPAFW